MPPHMAMNKARLASESAMLIFAVVVMTTAASQDDRITKIENGLLTTVVIRDLPAPMKLSERMAHYRVPGVSIAVIDGGQLAWAKGYGVRTAGSAEPVITDTRF